MGRSGAIAGDLRRTAAGHRRHRHQRHASGELRQSLAHAAGSHRTGQAGHRHRHRAQAHLPWHSAGTMRHKSHGCSQAGCRQRDSAPPPDRPGRSGRVLDAPAVAVDTARFRQTRDSRRVEFRRRYVRMQFAVLPSAQLVGGPGTSHSVGVRQPADRQRSAARTWTVDRTADRCGR